MPNVNNEVVSPQKTEVESKTEVSRAKTPLARLREKQAIMRGDKPTAGRASKEGQASRSANSYKRREHQRKSG